MTIYYISWFILALVILILEINLMSFYLMAVALGMIGGGIAAFMGYDFDYQLIIASVITIIAACFSFYLRKKLKLHSDRSNNTLDIGQRVTVTKEQIRTDGTALVNYRGAEWIAYVPEQILTPGIYHIEKLDGTKLVLGNKIPDSENFVQKPDTTTPSNDERP